jgi:hypothetical protein
VLVGSVRAGVGRRRASWGSAAWVIHSFSFCAACASVGRSTDAGENAGVGSFVASIVGGVYM